MSKNTPNSPRQNPPAEKLPIEPWTLRQAANWILFRDLDQTRRAKGDSLSASGFYAAKDDPNFPQRREKESDLEVSDRIEAYLNERSSTKKIEQTDWTRAQAELIESLMNSEIRAVSSKSDAATISADVWKMKIMTFPGPSYLRVFSDEIMRKWKPVNAKLAIEDQIKKPQKKHGGWDYTTSDEPLVEQAVNGVKAGTYSSAWAAAQHFSHHANGGGTSDSKAKRLLPKIKKTLSDS